MSFFQSIILGIIQGASEFLPISSSGHLILVPEFLGWEDHSLVLDTTLHLGTLAAVVIYFWKDLYSIIKSFLSDIQKSIKFKDFSSKSKLGFKIIVASFPAAILGFLLEDYFENIFRSALFVGLFMTFGTILMFFAEYFASKTPQTKEEPTFKQAIIIGIFQSLALFSGVSRSGATISGGMLNGLKRESAARFSFLLSVPIIFGAGILQLAKLISSGVSFSYVNFGVGFAASFLVGFIAIKFLMHYLKSQKLTIFIIYRLILAALIFIFLV